MSEGFLRPVTDKVGGTADWDFGCCVEAQESQECSESKHRGPHSCD